MFLAVTRMVSDSPNDGDVSDGPRHDKSGFAGTWRYHCQHSLGWSGAQHQLKDEDERPERYVSKKSIDLISIWEFWEAMEGQGLVR